MLEKIINLILKHRAKKWLVYNGYKLKRIQLWKKGIINILYYKDNTKRSYSKIMFY